MNEDVLNKFTEDIRKSVIAHGNILKCMVSMEAMKSANEERRSHGKPDKYSSERFIELSNEIETHTNALNKKD